MSEISVQFGNQLNGYNKTEVNIFVKSIEEKLQERAAVIDTLQARITDLEARVETLTTPETVEAVERLEKYDQLMKKMEGDYQNLLAPAIAKAKTMEAQAEHDYDVRLDQARAAAEEIYNKTADRIGEAVDQNMERLYQLLDNYMYSKSLRGRIKSFTNTCNAVSYKIASEIVEATKEPEAACKDIAARLKQKVDTYKKKFSI